MYWGEGRRTQRGRFFMLSSRGTPDASTSPPHLVLINTEYLLWNFFSPYKLQGNKYCPKNVLIESVHRPDLSVCHSASLHNTPKSAAGNCHPTSAPGETSFVTPPSFKSDSHL